MCTEKTTRMHQIIAADNGEATVWLQQKVSHLSQVASCFIHIMQKAEKWVLFSRINTKVLFNAIIIIKKQNAAATQTGGHDCNNFVVLLKLINVIVYNYAWLD